MTLEIIAPNKTVFKKHNIKYVSLTTTSGLITIYENHSPLISRISTGEIEVSYDNSTEFFAAIDGVIQVVQNNITILVDLALSASEIVEDDVLKAKSDAENILKSKVDLSDTEIAHLESVIGRETLKLNVLNLYKRRKS